MALLGRQVWLDIGQAGESGRRYAGLRISFRVAMTRKREPNHAVIEVYGLAQESIGQAQRKGAVFRLFAGYDVPRQIFQGTAVKDGVAMLRRGPERTLHVEALDGGSRYQAARVDVSYTTAVSLQRVVDEVASQMDLPTGSIRIATDIEFPRGVALRGPARDVLDRIAVMSGADWWIADGALFVVPTAGDLATSVVEVSAEAGNLIGSPTPKDRTIEVVALLEPGLRPGHRFSLRSRDYTGTYRIREVTFHGDSGWDRDFYATLTAVEA